MTLDDIKKDRQMISQDPTEYLSKIGGGTNTEACEDRMRTPLASEARHGAGGKRKAGGTVIQKTKISQAPVTKIASSSIKRPSMT